MFDSVTVDAGQATVSFSVIEPAPLGTLNGPSVACPLPPFPGTESLPPAGLAPFIACSVQAPPLLSVQSKSTLAVSPGCGFVNVRDCVLVPGVHTAIIVLVADIDPPVSSATE